MIDETGWIILIFAAAIGGLLYLLYLGDKRFDIFRGLAEKPALHFNKLDNSETLQYIITLLPDLNVGEKQAIIQSIFGRAVKFQMGQDSSGKMWFEGILAYEESPDTNHDLTALPKIL